MEHPGYYAVIPASVRYDESIPPNAKLLYGEITALCHENGYTDLPDEAIAAPYKMSDRAIRKLIKALTDSGYLLKFPKIDPETGATDGRYLALRDISPAILQVLNAGICAQGGGTKIPRGVEQKFHPYIMYSNIYNPPKPPQGGEPKKRARGYREEAEFLPERFEKFWDYYRSHVPAGHSPGKKQMALKAWDKLKPSAELVDKMGKALAEQVTSDEWQRGFGICHASTWLNNHCWLDDCGGNAAADEPVLQPETDGDAGWQ